MTNSSNTKDTQGASEPQGQSVDCDVCVAKAGTPCYIQTSADEHWQSGSVYTPGNTYRPERFHIGARTKSATKTNPQEMGGKDNEQR